jgi:hypothetical protein
MNLEERMKYLSLLLALTLLACSNKDAQLNTGATTAPPPAETPMNDNARVADARAQLVEQLKQLRDEQLKGIPADEKEARELVAQTYGGAITRLARQATSDPKELEAFARQQYREVRKQILETVRAWAAAQLIARINPDPMPGEKREAVESDGSCTNDIIVDMQLFEIKTLDTMAELQSLNQSGGPLASVRAKLATNSLVEKCDEIADRYDPKAVCSFKLPDQEAEQINMSEFKQNCESYRKQFSELN